LHSADAILQLLDERGDCAAGVTDMHIWHESECAPVSCRMLPRNCRGCVALSYVASSPGPDALAYMPWKLD
jgi:hypothetical protein